MGIASSDLLPVTETVTRAEVPCESSIPAPIVPGWLRSSWERGLQLDGADAGMNLSRP